jgi:hypothetical protein
MYARVNPSIALSSLRRLAGGRESHIPLPILANHLLMFGLCAEKKAPPAPKNDSVLFCERLYALKDARKA